MTTRATSSIIVGREADLARLREALKRVRAGEPATVLVGGEAGVGKSRLVDEFGSLARNEGAVVARGGCLELGDEAPPMAPLAAALRDLLRQRGREIFGGYEDEFARLLPELGPAAVDHTGEVHRHRLFDLVGRLLERVSATGPLVFVVEDLHWADRSTRDLVAYLVRSGPATPVLLLGTYRSDELHRGHPLRAYLGELDRARGVERFELDRLDRDGTADVLAELLDAQPSAALIGSVYARSQGNPFFIEELAACGGGLDDCNVPDSLRDLLLARVDRLPEAAQRVLRVAGAGGNRIAHGLLAEVSGIAEGDLDEALRTAVAAQLMVAEADGDGYEFRHTLVREAVHEDLLPGEHARLHARYAAAIAADPGLVEAGRAPSELAYHWYAAHDAARALAAAWQAADVAGSRYAYAEQRRLLERVLELWEQVPDAAERIGVDRLNVLEGALAAAIGAGDFDRAFTLSKGALAEVDAAAEPLRAAALLTKRAKLLRTFGRADGAAELARAHELTRGAADAPGGAALLADLAAALIHLDEQAAGRAAQEAAAAARAVGDAKLQISATVTFARVCSRRLPPDVGLAEMRRVAELAAADGDTATRVRAWINISDLLFEVGRYAESAEVAAGGFDDARRIGTSRTTGVFLLGNHAEALAALGRWDEAEAVAREAYRLDAPGAFELLGLVHWARLRLARGHPQAPAMVARAVSHLGRPYLETQFRLPLRELRIDTALAAGDRVAARDAVAAALADPSLSDDPRYAWPVLAAAARAAGGDTLVAARIAELVLELPARYPAEQAYAADVGAALAPIADAGERAAAAVAAWRAAGQPYPLGQALLRLAGAVAAVDRAAAAEALAEAAALAEALDAKPLRSAAAVLGRRIGVAGRGTRPAPDSTLTDRELEVLRLVAAGRSNRQIADELYISPKTASVHVSRIIAKLAVANRVEAAAVGHRLGLVAPLAG